MFMSQCGETYNFIIRYTEYTVRRRTWWKQPINATLNNLLTYMVESTVVISGDVPSTCSMNMSKRKDVSVGPPHASGWNCTENIWG